MGRHEKQVRESRCVPGQKGARAGAAQVAGKRSYIAPAGEAREATYHVATSRKQLQEGGRGEGKPFQGDVRGGVDCVAQEHLWPPLQLP